MYVQGFWGRGGELPYFGDLGIQTKNPQFVNFNEFIISIDKIHVCVVIFVYFVERVPAGALEAPWAQTP